MNSNNVIVTIMAKLEEANKTLIQANRYGNSDIVEFEEATPFGFGGNPPKGTPLVSVKTDRGNYVIGALTAKKKIEAGESIQFAMDKDGKEIVSHVITLNDGTVHVNGDDDHAVKYSKLEDWANDLQSKFNDLVKQFNTLLGSASAAGIPVVSGAIPATPSTAQISPAKSNKVKLS